MRKAARRSRLDDDIEVVTVHFRPVPDGACLYRCMTCWSVIEQDSAHDHVRWHGTLRAPQPRRPLARLAARLRTS